MEEIKTTGENTLYDSSTQTAVCLSKVTAVAVVYNFVTTNHTHLTKRLKKYK